MAIVNMRVVNMVYLHSVCACANKMLLKDFSSVL